MSNHNLPLSSSRKQVQRSGEQFPSRYYYVINQKVNCDVKLLTDDGAVIYARKIDLADASAYFDAMFNRFDKMDKDHVVLKDLDSMALRLIVDYVYTDDITITEENVKDLLATANYLGFLFILHTCCEFLQDHLKPSNCLSTKAFADLHGCLILLSSSESYIKHNILEVIECDEFYSISSERVEELIKLIHYIEHTNSNEKQVIKCIMSWINREWNYRKHDLYKLLEHVNLPLTSKKCIIKGVDERSSADNVIENIKSEQLIAANIDKVILVFGWSSVRAECFIEWYDPEIKEWNLGPKISGYDTRSNLVERNGVFVYAVGSFSTSKSVYMLDLSSHSPSWISKEPMFIQRSELGVGLLNDWIYAVGGFNGNHNLNEVEAFNVHTEEWKMVSSMSTSRGDVGVGVLNNLLYAVGGFDELSGEYLKSVERYHPSFDQWTPIAEMSTCRSGHGVGVLNGLMYIIGGHDGPFYHKSVEVYNPDTGHWTSTTDMHVCRTNPGMGVVVLHGLLYVLGGRSAFYDNVSSVEIYNPNTKAWEYMETASSNVGKIYGGVVVNKFPHFITN
ncbi:kelch-like protein 2 isoform X1 [Rhopalosiphum padi]|uniref:kelch-like protein 2 isoform X1 n=2 Tax=Rhopalosiphum padi TaxID=40932 RepID=UPI00298D6A36|nr:kelch-like protein 2 isoform X1 [Rhopalosiphum padi]XP_060835302.1 kelch-like protein 2 isoform X1 [Rhopalosiphum padi]